MLFRSRDALFHPIVEKIDQSIHEAREIQDDSISFSPIFEVFPAHVTDSSHFVHPGLVPEAFVLEDLGGHSMVDEVNGREPFVHPRSWSPLPHEQLMGDFDGLDESLPIFLRDQQNVLAIFLYNRQISPASGIVVQESINDGFSAFIEVLSRFVINEPADHPTSRMPIPVGAQGLYSQAVLQKIFGQLDQVQNKPGVSIEIPSFQDVPIIQEHRIVSRSAGIAP